MYQLRTGDLIVKTSGGGSGVGNPKERDPEKVLNDVIDEFISLDVAENIYRVAIDPKTMKIDWEKTRTLRGNP
jgi:N-methylhydantoinase B/oxoprolinase/acetone carboxylase alpha subunit